MLYNVCDPCCDKIHNWTINLQLVLLWSGNKSYRFIICYRNVVMFKYVSTFEGEPTYRKIWTILLILRSGLQNSLNPAILDWRTWVTLENMENMEKMENIEMFSGSINQMTQKSPEDF